MKQKIQEVNEIISKICHLFAWNIDNSSGWEEALEKTKKDFWEKYWEYFLPEGISFKDGKNKS